MIHIIFMAAGNSRRFPGNKLLTGFHGKELYRYGFDLFREIAYNRDDVSLTVVTQYPEILEQVQRCFSVDPKWNSVTEVVSHSPESVNGMSYTIRNGVRSVLDRFGCGGRLPASDLLLFAVADQPYLSKGSVERLIESGNSGDGSVCDGSVRDGSLPDGQRPKIWSLSYQEVPGNPKIFSAELAAELMQLTGDEGGRRLVKKYGCAFVEAGEERELYDIDTISDLNL